jgi:hypothetical protein
MIVETETREKGLGEWIWVARVRVPRLVGAGLEEVARTRQGAGTRQWRLGWRAQARGGATRWRGGSTAAAEW